MAHPALFTAQQRTTIVRRLTRAYRASTPAQRAAGLGWYAEALRVAQEISDVTGMPVRAVVGIIAALSPRTQWSTNVMWTRAVVNAALAGLPCPAVHTEKGMRPQAWRIAQGADPLDVLQGPKVRAFFANIMGDHNAVTVDIWAIRAALRDAAPTDSWITVRMYREIADLYRRAAVIVGVTPREAQAAIWVHARGIKPTDAAFHADAAAALQAAA